MIVRAVTMATTGADSFRLVFPPNGPTLVSRTGDGVFNSKLNYVGQSYRNQ